ncbi:cleavage and polyadenylation specificity factor subunit 1 [Cloeon dipterum]|uniref:cleavage and polyadenylation specificity factor subunit 1 n=1 Tax=Cloeon dipterum TaxID=197152 RepID=UPI00321FADF3
MFSLCKQTHPPTAVEHSVCCNFFNRNEKSLVVAGANVLRVFRLLPDIDHKKKDKYGENRPPKMKLECLASYTLWGNVVSLSSATLAGSARDALLISFKEAKLSLVEYDPDKNDLRTLSLHYFEDDDMRGGWTQMEQRLPAIRVDPENRCAVMLGYGRKLIILPFRKELSPEDSELMQPSSNADVKPMSQHLNNSANASKSPVLASYSIALKDLDEKMDNVIDVQFLHGYYEPTILILFEPIKTFAGRLAVRKDTVSMVAVSLSLNTRVHPTIWSISGLPHDCLQAVPVMKPLGGTLILATNSLLYLNQSVPPYGVAVNSVADTSTNFLLKNQGSLNLSLDCAQACFIANDKLVVSLHGGELYVVSLLADSMRSVRGFHFERAAASVLTTCITLCEDNYLFLGSRLGNSLLLRYTMKDEVALNGHDEEEEVTILDDKQDDSEPPSKKKKHLDNLGDCMATNVAELKDPEELEVYGKEDKASVQITSFSFEVCDSLLNIGPCGNISIGEPAFLSEEFSTTVNADLELLTTAGHGKNGALCVLQRSVRPQVVTTFELPGVSDMWTVAAPGKTNAPLEDGVDDVEAGPMHAFLVLSRTDSSIVLQTGHEINEVDSSGFSTQGPTVYAGNLGNNKYIVQVCQMGVRLLLGVDLLQHIPLDLGSPVVHASCADPYVVLLCCDGQVVLLTLKEARQPSLTRLAVSKLSIAYRPQVTALCAYRDVSGLFCGAVPYAEIDDEPDQPDVEAPIFEAKKELDDEDELLYGDSDMPIVMQPPAPEPEQDAPKKNTLWWQKYLSETKASFWLLMTRENGTLEIYSLPDCKLCFLSKHVSSGPKVLVDNLEVVPVASNSSSASSEAPTPIVRELLVAPLGHLGSRPLLMIRLDEELLLYQAFYYAKGHPMPIRFSKMNHNVYLRERKPKSKKKQAAETQAETSEMSVMSPEPVNCQLRYFRNIASYNGVLVCGVSPHWIFLTSRGELRAHPMHIDGPIPCFAPFHNVNCSQGFLYFNNKSELRICVLPTHLSYDAPWPCRKVPLRCTAHFVAYHLESKTYCVVTSISEPSSQIFKFNGEDKELVSEKRSERFPLPSVPRFSLLLFSPVSWEVIPNTKTELDEWEHVSCLKNVRLADEGTHSGLKGFVAIGTNYNYGEDITSRGRILIFDIIEVVPEPGQPLTKNRFKSLYSKEQKGPVTAITHCSGFLVSAVGQKIYIWQMKDNDLVGIAFIDTQIYIHQMFCINSLILVADVYKSISLLRFQEEYRTLSLVSKDFRPAEVYSTEFLIDNSQMGFLISDRQKNIVLYMYQPESRDSFGGQRLIRRGDYHLGQHINSFFRVRCRWQPDNSAERKLPAASEKRHLSMFATLDGGLGYVLPLPEKTYRRLLMLQNVMVNHMQHVAGLNPKAFRTFRNTTKVLGNAARGMVDGELVWQYWHLPIGEKWDVAKKIGTKVDDILDDMIDIERLVAQF